MSDIRCFKSSCCNCNLSQLLCSRNKAFMLMPYIFALCCERYKTHPTMQMYGAFVKHLHKRLFLLHSKLFRHEGNVQERRLLIMCRSLINVQLQATQRNFYVRQIAFWLHLYCITLQSLSPDTGHNCKLFYIWTLIFEIYQKHQQSCMRLR